MNSFERHHRRHSILVVDDDAEISDMLGTLLSRDGFDVLTAKGPVQALDLLKGHLPCMILLDVMMPGMDGFELCRMLKRDSLTAHIPVALVTARAQEGDVQEGIAAGAVDYIKKPFDRDELRMRVRTQIRLHEAHVEQERLHKHLKVISSAAHDAIVIIDNEGKISHWNEAAERIFGYSRSEVVGQNLHTLLVPSRFHAAHGRAFPRFQATGEGDAVGKTLELAAIRKSGEEFPVELSLAAASVDDEWCAIGIVRDISKRKHIQDLLQQSENQYRLLYKASRDALMTLAPPSWKFISCNQATVEMFGASSEADFTRLGPGDVSPEYQPDGQLSSEKAGEVIGRAMQEGSAAFRWMHTRLGGEAFLCDVLLTRVDNGGEVFLQATVRDVTEQVRAASALAASEARYRASFEDASVGQVLASNKGRFLQVNPALAGMLGYPVGELLGRTFAQLTHPDDVAKSMAAQVALLSGQRQSRMEKRYLRKDGTALWADVSVAALRDANGNVTEFITHVIDLTERKRIENKLRSEEQAAKQSGEFLNTILNAIPVPVFYKDPDCNFIGINNAYQRFFGRSREDLLGKTVFDLFPRELAEVYHKKDLELLEQPGTQTYDTQATDAHGDIHHVFAHKATFTNGDGRLGGILGALIDVTERKQIETELGHARKLEAVGQLAAGIAHEINTPAQYVGDGVYFLKEVFQGYRQLIGKYRSAAEVLERSGQAAELVRQIRELENEIDLAYIEENVPGSFDRCIDGISRISTIVRAMKEFSHPDQREKSPADLNQGIQSTLIIARNEYKYVAEMETEFGELPPVLCHLGDLNQVFLNLIVNAAHAIGDKVVEQVEKGVIRIRTCEEADSVRIDISDTGGGIPESIRARIFDPFFTTKAVGKGSGQGLAIARSIVVDKHGGTLTFESETGCGTTFTIRLPLDGRGSVGREKPI